MVKGIFGQIIFSDFFFHRRFGSASNRVGPGRIWTKGSADDVIGDVMPAEARVRYGAWPRVALAKEVRRV